MYATKEELVKALKEQYLQDGVILTTKRSKENRIVLKCDRGGTYQSRLGLTEETRRRKSHTRLTGCLFEIVCTVQKGVWAVRKMVETHNHPLSTNFAGHSVARRPTAEEKSRIQQLGELGIPPKSILSVLQTEFHNQTITLVEIYNELTAARLDFLKGRKPIEALIEIVSGEAYFSNVRMAGLEVECVFFMHEHSVALCRKYGTVFLMDCTCKTNKFNMPLLNIVGITSTNQTFNAGFAFIHAENEENFTWVLHQFAQIVNPVVICTDRDEALMRSVAAIFPNSKNLICVRHINKNILANCKKHFEVGAAWGEFISKWNAIVYSGTVDAFQQSLDEFVEAYSITHKAAWKYLSTTWLPHKDKFVACFINQFPHFGTSSTSRVEGSHHVIKSYVRLGKLDLLVVFKRLSFMLANQQMELDAEIERQKMIRAHHLDHDIFENLHYRVSLFALEKINGQLKNAQEQSHATEQCTQQFIRTWGLPCKHSIRNFLETKRRLALSDIHVQWHLEQIAVPAPLSLVVEKAVTPRKRLITAMEQELYSGSARAGSMTGRFNQVIENPSVQVQRPAVVVKKRGRPAGAKNKNNMTRDKSQFEYAQGRKCGTCGIHGHNSRTCSQ